MRMKDAIGCQFDYRIVQHQGLKGISYAFDVCKVMYNSAGKPFVHEGILGPVQFESLDEVKMFCEAGDKPVLIYDEIKVELYEKPACVEEVSSPDTKSSENPQSEK